MTLLIKIIGEHGECISEIGMVSDMSKYFVSHLRSHNWKNKPLVKETLKLHKVSTWMVFAVTTAGELNW